VQLGTNAGAGLLNLTPQSAIDGLYIDQDNAAKALSIDSESTTETVLIYAKHGIRIYQDIINGYAIRASRNNDGAEAVPLAQFINDHTSDTYATLLLQNDGSGPHITTGATNEDLEIDPNGTGDVKLIDTDLFVYGDEATSAIINMFADDGDDNDDKWRLVANDGGSFDLETYATGSWVDMVQFTHGGGSMDLTMYLVGAAARTDANTPSGRLRIGRDIPLGTGVTDGDTAGYFIIASTDDGGNDGVIGEIRYIHDDVTAASNNGRIDIALSKDAALGTQTVVGRWETQLAAGETSLWLYDGSDATLRQVLMGADDSGGAGYKLLRVAN